MRTADMPHLLATTSLTTGVVETRYSPGGFVNAGWRYRTECRIGGHLRDVQHSGSEQGAWAVHWSMVQVHRERRSA